MRRVDGLIVRGILGTEPGGDMKLKYSSHFFGITSERAMNIFWNAYAYHKKRNRLSKYSSNVNPDV